MSKTNEMAAAGLGAGPQLPIGAKERKDEIDTCMKQSEDLKEGHVLVFLRNASPERLQEFYDALDLRQHDTAAGMVREDVVRLSIRKKIYEVVRKKAGGGGFVLYAPNKGKKHNSKPVASFPTKLAAKRAQLARFPPKDPKKLARLRKEIARLMKDPKKRADVEKKAAHQKGAETSAFTPTSAAPAPKVESFDRALVERAILAEAVLTGIRRQITEGLFKEDAPQSEWDSFLSKISSNVLANDKGFKRIQKQLGQATEGSLQQAMKIIQRQIGATARVKPSGPAQTKDGTSHIPFILITDGAEVGPVYLYVKNGIARLEFSDEAKNSLTKVEPEMARTIRGALATAEDALAKVSGVQNATAQRDQYLAKLEGQVDKMIASMSPLQISMLKNLLVKKYRSATK